MAPETAQEGQTASSSLSQDAVTGLDSPVEAASQNEGDGLSSSTPVQTGTTMATTATTMTTTTTMPPLTSLSNGAISMPALHSFSTQHQQQQQQQQASAPINAITPIAQVAQMTATPSPYFHSTGFPAITTDVATSMRYALPTAVDARIMAGLRNNKKEIKRRTKTGCLTCRKRRIKCDEGQPTCRNCVKSKRECLGYDPIFKQQGHTPIQPAPSTTTPTSATKSSYSQDSSVNYSLNTPTYDAALSSTPTSAASRTKLEYSTNFEPPLGGAPPPTMPLKAKLPVQGLLELQGNVPPPPTDSSQDPSKLEESKRLYYSIYAPGLDSFLETKWYSLKGQAKLLGDRRVLDMWQSLLDAFAKTQTADAEQMRVAANTEAHVVWNMAMMVRAAAGEVTTAEFAVPAADDATEAARRLTTFENLITGHVADGNNLTNPAQCQVDTARARELEFWYHLANFVCFREDDPKSFKDTEEILGKMRNLLDGRENRDVLYSIAVIRALTGQRIIEYHEGQIPLQLDETDPRNKLHVAKRFITNEAGGTGTTNVIRRLCELVTRQMHHTSSLTAYPDAARPAAAATTT